MFADNVANSKCGFVIVHLRMVAARSPCFLPMWALATVEKYGWDACMPVDTACRVRWMQTVAAKKKARVSPGLLVLPT